ncbi:MAG: hypothetical protein AB7K52_00765 [Phycisphaerales bacterium]
MTDAWRDLPMHPDTSEWGEYSVLPFVGAFGVMVYAAQSREDGRLAVILEFPSATTSLAIPDFSLTAIAVERMALPGLGPDRSTIAIELRRAHLFTEFMAFADQIVTDLIDGPEDSATQLQVSLRRWSELLRPVK